MAKVKEVNKAELKALAVKAERYLELEAIINAPEVKAAIKERDELKDEIKAMGEGKHGPFVVNGKDYDAYTVKAARRLTVSVLEAELA